MKIMESTARIDNIIPTFRMKSPNEMKAVSFHSDAWGLQIFSTQRKFLFLFCLILIQINVTICAPTRPLTVTEKGEIPMVLMTPSAEKNFKQDIKMENVQGTSLLEAWNENKGNTTFLIIKDERDEEKSVNATNTKDDPRRFNKVMKSKQQSPRLMTEVTTLKHSEDEVEQRKENIRFSAEEFATLVGITTRATDEIDNSLVEVHNATSKSEGKDKKREEKIRLKPNQSHSQTVELMNSYSTPKNGGMTDRSKLLNETEQTTEIPIEIITNPIIENSSFVAPENGSFGSMATKEQLQNERNQFEIETEASSTRSVPTKPTERIPSNAAQMVLTRKMEMIPTNSAEEISPKPVKKIATLPTENATTVSIENVTINPMEQSSAPSTEKAQIDQTGKVSKHLREETTSTSEKAAISPKGRASTIATERDSTGIAKDMTVPVSATIFQVTQHPQTTTTRFPINIEFQTTFAASKLNGGGNKQQTESKISDIQIEIYDSTVDSILSSTNFKENNDFFRSPLDHPMIDTTSRAPLIASNQKKFTQYVVDHSDFSTQESGITAQVPIAVGGPKPAAIEIHINVSEALGNEDNNDLDDLYRGQGEAEEDHNSKQSHHHVTSINLKPPNLNLDLNNSAGEADEHDDEELIVEIIDNSGYNNNNNNNSHTVSSNDFEDVNIKPLFVINSDDSIRDDRAYIKNSNVSSEIATDESIATNDLFKIDFRRERNEFKKNTPEPSKLSNPDKTIFPNHDSDTIFYISNTEVKVGESPPTARSSLHQDQSNKTHKLETQYVPTDYVRNSTLAPKVSVSDGGELVNEHRYEEDIIISPLQNTADSVKILRHPDKEFPPPPDITYVGESVMEIEQSASGLGLVTTVTTDRSLITSKPKAPTRPSSTAVVVEPSFLPDVSIGVPIIGELPPQIEIKDNFYGLDESSDNEESGRGSEKIDEKTLESSVQYGGDLIDEGGVINGGGFDSPEGAYPFGNAAIKAIDNFRIAGNFPNQPTETIHDRTNNFKKDDLIADISSSDEFPMMNSFLEGNITLRGGEGNPIGNRSMNLFESQKLNENDVAHSENETAFTIMENSYHVPHKALSALDYQLLSVILIATIVPLVLAIYCGKRYIYRRLRGRSLDRNDSTNYLANGKAACNNDADEMLSGSHRDIDTETDREHLTTSAANIKNRHRHNLWDVSILSPTPIDSLSINQSIPCRSCVCDVMNVATSKASSKQSKSVLGSHTTGPNGSVTTMTLKNNHLIVETEERNDISRNARETKMHYNTGEKDGIFVVEVSRGVDSKSMPDSPVTNVNQGLLTLDTRQFCGVSATAATVDSRSPPERKHESVQIHPPPQGNHNPNTLDELQMALHQIEEVDEPIPSPHSTLLQNDMDNFGLGRVSSIGLSQSDLSSDSSDSNKHYSYGNQELYTLDKPVCSSHPPMREKTYAQDFTEEINHGDDPSDNGQNKPNTPAKSASISTGIVYDQQDRTPGEPTTDDDHQQRACPEEAVPKDEGNTLQNLEAADEPLANLANGNPDKADKDTEGTEGMTELEGSRGTEINNNDYDNMASFPNPPSIEEIKELIECNFSESNQFDSLPPPPLPPPPPPQPQLEDCSTPNNQQQKPTDDNSKRSYFESNNLQSQIDPNAINTGLTGKFSSAFSPPTTPPHYVTCGNKIASASVVCVNGS